MDDCSGGQMAQNYKTLVHQLGIHTGLTLKAFQFHFLNLRKNRFTVRAAPIRPTETRSYHCSDGISLKNTTGSKGEEEINKSSQFKSGAVTRQKRAFFKQQEGI